MNFGCFHCGHLQLLIRYVVLESLSYTGPCKCVVLGVTAFFFCLHVHLVTGNIMLPVTEVHELYLENQTIHEDDMHVAEDLYIQLVL